MVVLCRRIIITDIYMHIYSCNYAYFTHMHVYLFKTTRVVCVCVCVCVSVCVCVGELVVKVSNLSYPFYFHLFSNRA